MYEFEKHLPKSEAHNIQRVEDKLNQAWMRDCFSIAHESDSLYLNPNRVEANRDKAVVRQMQGARELNFHPSFALDAVAFLESSGKSIEAIRKQDPANVDLPQLDLIQKRLESEVIKFNPEQKFVYDRKQVSTGEPVPFDRKFEK